MSIRLYMYCNSTLALGPYKRFAIWTQGCERCCPGCVSPDSQPMDGGFLIKRADLVQKILDADVEGITISGGEPFLQAEEMKDVITTVRAKGKNIGVIIYTGFTLDELKLLHKESMMDLLAVTDLLIDGKYIKDMDDGRSLRGSSNQNPIPLTERYVNYLDLYGAKGRKIELFTDELGESRFYGIPPKDYKKLIKPDK